ncbi:MAG: TOBE domain-containing protein, partial [Thermomicrobiales bacterium]
TYRAPVNTFVAGFIGNPRMNFINGKLSHSNGIATLEGSAATFPLAGDYLLAHASSEGRDVTLGIRPEHLILSSPGPSAVVAQVELVELVGPVSYLDLSIGDRSLRASVAGNSKYSIGQKVGVSFDNESLLLYDRNTGILL